MAIIQFEGKEYVLTPEDSVLTGLLRARVELAHSCQAGLCQSCLMQADKGTVPAAAQTGLTDNQKALGYFLSCQCQPASDLSIRRVDQQALTHSALVVAKDWLSAKVLRLRLRVDFPFRAGQYVLLKNTTELGRCYSIASTPQEGALECHIKIHPDGVFSQWLAQALIPGSTLAVQGPMGTCFYQATDEPARTRPLLLVGMSTGLAPLLGIVKSALTAGHTGQINLIACARHAEDAYGARFLSELAERHEQVSTHLLTLDANALPDSLQANVYDFVRQRWPKLTGYQVYLCGAESFVKKMKKQCFLSGASMSDILADSFG